MTVKPPGLINSVALSLSFIQKKGYPKPKNGQNMTVKPPGLIACRAICLNFRPKNGQNMT